MTLSAVMLAGGESQRMGVDKATILFRRRPLWRHSFEILREFCPGKIFVSARTRPSWLPPEGELLLDEPPSRGPLSGLTRAVTQMQTSHLVVLAIDMPFMTVEHLRTLWSLAGVGCGVLPMIGGRAEPLAAIYPREAGSDLCLALAGDDFSLQRLSQRLVEKNKIRTFRVPKSDQQLYRNLNEPVDLQA